MNWLLFKNSVTVGLGTTVLAVGLGFAAALFTSATGVFWRKVLLAAAAATLALPAFLVTNTWLHFFGAGGIWREWLPFPLFSSTGTMILLSLLLWPITLFSVWSSLQRVDSSSLETDLAVRGWALITGILWARIRNAVFFASAVTFVLAINHFAIPAILQVKVLPTEAWIRFSTNFSAVGALLAGWPLILISLLVIYTLQGREVPWPAFSRGVTSELFRRQLGKGFYAVSGALLLLVLGFSLVLPLTHLFFTTRTWAEGPAALAGATTALINSCWYAAVSATAVCVFALLLAGSRYKAHGSGFKHEWLLWLPFLVPGILLGIALLKLLNRQWLALVADTMVIVLLALLIRYFALAIFPLQHALSRTAVRVIEMARMDGLNATQTLRHVFWPTVAPVFGAVWYVVFLVCLWDVETIVLLYPPGGETLAVKIFNLLHYGHTAHVNTLCLLLLAVALLPLAGYAGFYGLRQRVRALGVFLAGVILTGCQPIAQKNSTAVDSLFFTQATVFGSRGAGVGQLNKPRSLATDMEGNVYVADMTGRVQKFSPSGAFLLSWQMPQTDQGKPKGMCRDHQGNIVVIEPHYQRLNHFSPSGQLLNQWGQAGTKAGAFTLPRDVDANDKGEMFVSEYGASERVQVFDLDGKFLRMFGSPGNEPGEFNRAEGLCVDKLGRVYVADSCNHRIQVFSSQGDFLYTYGKPGTALGELSYPYDISIDASGFQFVCEFGNSRIQVFDQNGQPVEIIGGPGSAPGRFANPWAIAVDDSGNLWVADSLNHRIQKLVRSNSQFALIPES
jgi:ABC-type Fe3+ transport system permease subunit/DNA-binding beta-propeller fold protein YncE